MDEEKISAELKHKLLEAEEQVKSAMPPGPDWKRGMLTGVFAFAAFFIFGLLSRAPVLSSLGFALVGGVTGVLVGAYRKPQRYGR